MPLLHSYKETGLGRFPFGKKLYAILEDFQEQLDEKNRASPIHVRDIKLNKTIMPGRTTPAIKLLL